MSVPNDTCASAITLTAGRSVDGTLATATNDYELSGGACFTGVGQNVTTADGGDAVYSFTAPAAANYSFKVVDPSGAGNLIIYTASTCPAGAPPVTVATCQNAANRSTAQVSEEVMCQAMTAGETVFIFVDSTSTDPLTTFKIEVTHCLLETEPNDTPATASANNPLAFQKEGSINPGTDDDFFSLGTQAADSRVFAFVDGSAGNGSDFQMRVTTTTDTLEFDEDAADAPFGIFAPNIGGTPLTGTETYLKINSFGSVAREPYRLYAIVEPAGANPISGCPAQTTSAIDETESNDTLATANTGPLGYFEGSISTGADIDLYSFTAAVGDFIYMSVDEDPCRDATPFNSSLSILDPVGTALITVNDAHETNSSTTSGAGSLTSTTPSSPAEALIFRIQVAGTYYARVESFGGSTGDYLLAVSRNSAAAVGPTATDGVVSGSITDANGFPVAGAVVRLSGTQNRKTITDANGNYRFDDVETNGFYTVRPSRANYSFSPAERFFSQLGNKTEAIFTATPNAVIGVNAIDTAEYFVRQHYVDFLGREPDESGFNFWSDQILGCGGDPGCLERKRINVSAAYFLSIEFQQTGGLVDGLYRASYGRRPLYAEFMPDAGSIAQGVVVGRGNWEQQLAANKQTFVNGWVQRAAFQSAYGSLGDDAYVDTLISHTGVSYSQVERDGLVSGLASGNLTRAGVLLRIAEEQRFVSGKRNEMFVMMEYFGYLRRDPDASGYQFWLNKLNQFNGNFEQAEMVKAFIVSGEYRSRF